MWYENVKPDVIYNNVHELINSNPNVKEEECVVFFINGDSGFGSQLTLLTYYGIFLMNLNNNIHCLGHFSVNNSNFKYHDDNKINSFFMYFRYLKSIPDNLNCYFVKLSTVLIETGISFILPQSVEGLNVDDIENNKIHANYFKNNFELIIGDHIVTNILNIKEETKIPLIGIHLRSSFQIKCHPYGRTFDIEEKLLKIKFDLDKKFGKYNIFLITDVSNYIDMVKNIFKYSYVYYNDFISRIDVDTVDSVINLTKYTGFKLGSDIIYDCLSLINCDFYYVSVTNIAFISSYINVKNNNGIHYN